MSAAYFKTVSETTQLADAYYQRGLVYLDKAGKNKLEAMPFLDKALSDFNSAIRINPTAAAHFVGRASTHMYKEEFQPAISDFTEAIRLSPGDEYTFLHRGIAYHSVNEPDNAIADYTEAHRINPKDVAPLINRGIVYYSKKGQYDLAIADFTEALKIDPKEVNALIKPRHLVAREGRPRQGDRRFHRGAAPRMLTADVLKFGSKDPDAVRHWAQVANARYQRGTAYVAKTEFDLALADFNESIRLNGAEARVFAARAGVYLARQEYQRAIQDLDESIRLDPSFAFAYFQRGFAYHAIEEPDKAFVDYTKSIELDPKYITSYLNRGIISYTRHGDYAAAIADFTKALALGPDNINALMHRGVAYAASNDFDKGMADLNRAIELSPEFGKAFYYRGIVYSMRGSFEHALCRISTPRSASSRVRPKATSTAPHSMPGSTTMTARSPISTRRSSSCPIRRRSITTAATRISPRASTTTPLPTTARRSGSIRRLAVAYNNRCLTRGVTGKDLVDALNDCDEALKLLPNSMDAHDTRGFIYLKLGDFPVAINEYNASLQLDPNRSRAALRTRARQGQGRRQGGRGGRHGRGGQNHAQDSAGLRSLRLAIGPVHRRDCRRI